MPLPGQPGEPAFEMAYQDALAGRQRQKAEVRRLPGAARPKSMAAAWRRAQQSPEWMLLDPATKRNNIRLAEAFLESRVHPELPELWRDMPIADLKRRHLKNVIAAYAATPHKAKHILTTIRKMIEAAIDDEWIDSDPSHKLHWRPAYKGWKAWPIEMLQRFEAHWPIGSKPRLVYALALWLGNRRSDVASVLWDQRTTKPVLVAGAIRMVDGFDFEQVKGGKRIFVPISPMLAEILAVTPKRGETVLLTENGAPHSAKALTNWMALWTAAAGIPPGHTLHGLRKTLGKLLAEGGASTRQLMEVLGHDDIEHAELYSREAEQAILAVEGMDKVVALHRSRRG